MVEVQAFERCTNIQRIKPHFLAMAMIANNLQIEYVVAYCGTQSEDVTRQL